MKFYMLYITSPYGGVNVERLGSDPDEAKRKFEEAKRYSRAPKVELMDNKANVLGSHVR